MMIFCRIFAIGGYPSTAGRWLLMKYYWLQSATLVQTLFNLCSKKWNCRTRACLRTKHKVQQPFQGLVLHLWPPKKRPSMTKKSTQKTSPRLESHWSEVAKSPQRRWRSDWPHFLRRNQSTSARHRLKRRKGFAPLPTWWCNQWTQ